MAQVAERQFGRIRWDQLIACGLHAAKVQNWVRARRLFPELPRVYAVGNPGRSTESDYSAALLYGGPGAALEAESALWWRGLLKRRPQRILVTTPRDIRSLPGIAVRGRRHLGRITYRRMPTTTVAQAIVDFAPRAEDWLLRYALANAEYARVLDPDEIQRPIGRGVPGSGRVRDALATYVPELAETRSDGERRLLKVCRDHGLPIPEVNVFRHGHLLDVLWEQERVVVEIDGFSGHRTPAQLHADHQRELKLRAAGHIVLRYSDRQLRERPSEVAADIARHLRR